MRAAMVPLRHTSPAAPCLFLAQSLEYAHTVLDVSIAAHSTYGDALDSMCRGGSFPWSFRQASHDRTEPHQPDDPPDLSSNDATKRYGVDDRGSTSNP
jgi:hypothetical protein